MMTIILSIAIMVAVAAALSLKVILGREREVRSFGCGNFNPIDPSGTNQAGRPATTACGVCGAQKGEACKNEESSSETASADRPDFSRN